MTQISFLPIRKYIRCICLELKVALNEIFPIPLPSTEEVNTGRKLEGNGPVARACGNDFYCRSSFGPVKSS